MNGRMAKALRRKAREVTHGLPERAMLQHQKTRVIINSPKTTQGVLKALKKTQKLHRT